MGKFDKDYFFIRSPSGEHFPELTPDMDTAEKPYATELLPIGGKPLIFYNGFLDFQKSKKITPIDPPPDVLFDGSDMVVCDRIADKLTDLEIPNLAIQPAIFIDHKDNWHENYWFLTFVERFDCWDREHSAYDPEPLDLEPPLYEMYSYSFNERLLQKTPLSERRLFKLEGTTDGYVVAHKSIVNLFRVNGVRIMPITDY